MAPDIVCGYKLLRELGTRALPAYAAIAPKARRPEDALCVVERLARNPELNAEAAAVFMRDAKRLSQVRHPNLVHVRDVVVGTSTVLLVTNWVDGEVYSDVARMAAEQAIPIPLAGSLRVVVDLLEGLSALHEVCDAKREPLRIVHAEVAPRNIVVGVDGRSVLVHPLRAPGAASGKNHAPEVLGYLAPEVLLADQTADQRADVYGAGVLLWEALTGQRMHAEGEDTGAIVMRLLGGHVEAPTPPIDAPWAAPLAEVAKKAISPDPTARFANATEMLAAVRRVVVARLAPKLTVSALVEAVAGERIRARNAALGVTRPTARLPTQSAWTSDAPPRALPPHSAPDDSVPPASMIPVSFATDPPATLDPDATKPPPSEPHPHRDGRIADAPPPSVVPASYAAPIAEAVRLSGDDRTPLITVDPLTGEERPVFRSDPPTPASGSMPRSDPPASADVIEVIEMDIPVDKPSRPSHERPPVPPARKSTVPRVPPLPFHVADRSADAPMEPTTTQSRTDMGSVARVALPSPSAGGKTRWTIVAACAVAVGLGIWLFMRPQPEPITSTPSTAASEAAPTPAPPPPAAAVTVAPPPAGAPPSAATPPANAPSPFDPSSADDRRPAPRAPKASSPAAAQPQASPAASSTHGKKRVYDPQGI